MSAAARATPKGAVMSVVTWEERAAKRATDVGAKTRVTRMPPDGVAQIAPETLRLRAARIWKADGLRLLFAPARRLRQPGALWRARLPRNGAGADPIGAAEMSMEVK
ncbi:MAG: hypothetical protein PHU80_06310 [Kiritimatiellae bacterium]|nr:hypothetical protein [Kiritimatiellia bacterium]